jgi:hypothetical protein
VEAFFAYLEAALERVSPNAAGHWGLTPAPPAR